MKSKIKMVVLTDSFLGRKGQEVTASTPRQMQQLIKSGIAMVKRDSPVSEGNAAENTEAPQKVKVPVKAKQGKK